jgi:pimeloyl-ACP methyl ester carboxylesterase
MVRRLVLATLVLVVLAVLLGPLLTRPVGKRLAMTEGPADYGLAYEAVQFSPPDRPITLRAWWLPAKDARAVLVFVHGGGEDNRNLPYGGGLALARDLVARRYTMLMIDLRNYGESDPTPEGITFGDLETNDVLGAAAFASARAPGLPLAAIGFSMGGATVLRAAAGGAPYRAIVADSAFADAQAIAIAFTVAATGMPRLLATPFVWSAEHVHGLPLGRGRTLEAVRGMTMPPTLLIYNRNDPIVPIEDGRQLATAIGATLWETDGQVAGPFGTHIKSYLEQPREYVERVTGFLDEALDGASGDGRGAR